MGIGNGDTRVLSVIAPFYKINESEAIVFLDNMFIRLSESSEPITLTQKEAIKNKEFYDLCEAFSTLGFKERNNEI